MSLERKGIVFREFLHARNEEGIFPKYQVHVGDEARFVYSKEELNALRAEEVELQRAAFQPEEGKVFEPSSFHYLQLYEDDQIDSIKTALHAFSLNMEQYIVAQGKILDILHEHGEAQPAHTIREILDVVRENGRKGIEIQRYKGLGEMNADQLWETTMDPAGRTLIQVNLADAIAADQMFSMLMGEEVKPRRVFIESHALSVKNLDI